MPSSVPKVTKQINKKKPGKLGALHENSRDAKRLRRANARDDKLNRVAAVRAKKTEPFLERIAFLQSAAQEHRNTFSLREMQSLVEGFLKRDEDALAELQAMRRPGRPASAGQDLLQAKLDLEQKEYNSGFWMPDLEDEPNVDRLRQWNGEWNSLDTMVFVRITRAGKKHASQFPPHREN
ncbi:hypothetical protein EV356DRAFT_144229 [Viridothelium virens]|uniref:Translation machinery-associated protein 16 n=1 Tax=Viridothelium virens TaxID=1048519 RepID=A0A6A6HBB2_VIRVR|nr:hypothetical protein EV356DRAFT_144229 [Viridothelium virens]